MHTLVLAALSLLILGCAPQGRKALIVEDGTPIVGRNGATTEALGVETLGGLFTPLIKAGTRVPCSVSETFGTAADGSEIMVTLSRGNEELAANNHALGRFQIVGIPAARRGVPRVEVTFAITERQISLSARDLTHNTTLRIRRVAGDRG
jgi:molecular chaperone DnaK